MGFIEDNLSTNEKIVYTTGLHWWIQIKNILLMFAGFVVIVFFHKERIALYAGGLIILIGLIGSLSTQVKAKATEFVVTNRRVLFKTGMLSRKLIEIQLNRSEGLRVDQSIMGRIFNFGTIFVTSGSVNEVFSPVARPYEFKKQINNAIETSFNNGQGPLAY